MTPDGSRPVVAEPLHVFVTGANGFIGGALATRLRDLGCTVTGVDLEADPDHGVAGGSTTDPSGWADALDGVDVVIHTAAIVSNAASLDRAWEVNVLGTRRVTGRRRGPRRTPVRTSLVGRGIQLRLPR